MEHDPLKPRLEVLEIQEEIKEGERIAQEIQKYIDSHLENLKFHIEELEFATGYLDHMKSSNEFREDYKAKMGTESCLREYSQQEIQDIQNNIAETKALSQASMKKCMKQPCSKLTTVHQTKSLKSSKSYSTILCSASRQNKRIRRWVDLQFSFVAALPLMITWLNA